jgi:hypothetical protein
MYSRNSKKLLFTLVLAMGLVAACGTAGKNEATEPVPESSATKPGTELPPGHPPIGQGSVAPPPLGSGEGSAGLAWAVPEVWVEETPSSRMRRAQYRVPGESGDGECVVFYFGPGEGGDAKANAQRWAAQFEQPDGRSSSDVMKTRMLNVNGIPVMLIEVTGTYYAGSMTGGPTERMPEYMLLGAIAEGPDANWFFKFTGPEATVKANQGAFEKMLQSLHIS